MSIFSHVKNICRSTGRYGEGWQGGSSFSPEGHGRGQSWWAGWAGRASTEGWSQLQSQHHLLQGSQSWVLRNYRVLPFNLGPSCVFYFSLTSRQHTDSLLFVPPFCHLELWEENGVILRLLTFKGLLRQVASFLQIFYRWNEEAAQC